MSEEIKDLFQRENIKTMKKDLRSLAELETQDKKEQFLDAPKKEKTAVPIPPAPTPTAGIKIPIPEPTPIKIEEEFLGSDTAQQMANRFSRIKKDQEEKAKIFEDQSQKEMGGQKKIEEQDMAGQKRKEEERLAEQKKKEIEQKEKEKLDKALSLAQEKIINTAKVPPAPAPVPRPTTQVPSVATSSAPLPPPAPNFIAAKTPELPSLKNAPSKDQYKEILEETEKVEAPKMFAKKGAPFFNAPKPRQEINTQASQPVVVKKEDAKTLSKDSPNKIPAAEIKQEFPSKPAVASTSQKVDEKKEAVPEEKPAPKPVQTKTADPIDEKELLKSLDEKEKKIDKDLLKIVQEKIPVNLQSEEISKGIEKIKQSQLQKVLAEEAEEESAIKQLESKEKAAASDSEKRKIETERQEVEIRREKIEEQRYQIEDSMKNLEVQLNECEKNYLRISDGEKKLLKEKADIKNQKEIIDLSKKKTALEQSLAELNGKTDSLKSELSSVLKEKDGLKEKLARASEEEQKTETEIGPLEDQEANTKESARLREIEAQRKILAEKRKEAEKARWDFEDQKKKIEIKENEIKKEYQATIKKMEEISKELKMIEDRSSRYNG